MTLRLWDVRDSSKPITEVNIHDHLRPKLCDLYESDAIFDKFKCSIDFNADYFLTGTYNRSFSIYDRRNNTSTTMSTSVVRKSEQEAPQPASGSLPRKTKSFSSKNSPSKGISPQVKKPEERIDTENKILFSSWHPKDNTIAVGVNSTLYIYLTE